MIYKKINLKDYYPMLDNDVYLTSYCGDNTPEIDINRKKRTLLVIPGGGYAMCSDRENEPIALRFLGYDINCFNLVYNCPPSKYPYPAIEGMAALAYIRSHAEEYHVDVNHIGVIGFSAGGHLAGTLSMWSESIELANMLNVEPNLLKVNFFISCYSVITMDEYNTHLGTMQNLTKNDEELKEKFAIEKHISKDFPPTYIFATEDDEIVPVINSKILYEALIKQGIKVNMHIYPHGRHGLSLANRAVYPDYVTDEELKVFEDAQGWVDEAIKFIYSL